MKTEKERVTKISLMNKDHLVQYVMELEDAFTDVVDGQSRWDEIRDQTGCSEERCKEIEKLFKKVMKDLGYEDQV